MIIKYNTIAWTLAFARSPTVRNHSVFFFFTWVGTSMIRAHHNRLSAPIFVVPGNILSGVTHIYIYYYTTYVVAFSFVNNLFIGFGCSPLNCIDECCAPLWLLSLMLFCLCRTTSLFVWCFFSRITGIFLYFDSFYFHLHVLECWQINPRNTWQML